MSRTIVITGAGIGLGRALARRCTAAGDNVVLLGRTASRIEALAAELGASALGVACDVASADSVRAAFAAIAERHPAIDVLINNAAIYEPFTIAEATDAQVTDPLMINLAGPIYCARAAIPMMRAGGHIINVTSESVTLPIPMLGVYAASKAGLERLSVSLSQELAPSGIRVTVVRAGQMMEEGKTTGWDPAIAMRFGQACIAAGIDVRSRPISHVNSVVDAFLAIINMPADVQMEHVSLIARRP